MVVDEGETCKHQFCNQLIPFSVGGRFSFLTFGQCTCPDIPVPGCTARIMRLQREGAFTKTQSVVTFRPPWVFRLYIRVNLNVIDKYLDEVPDNPHTHRKPFIIVYQRVIYIPDVVYAAGFPAFGVPFRAPERIVNLDLITLLRPTFRLIACMNENAGIRLFIRFYFGFKFKVFEAAFIEKMGTFARHFYCPFL